MKRNIRLVVAALMAACASFVAEAANHANIVKGVFLDATTGTPLGTARYVGKNGSDAPGDGSVDNPYLTIQKAIDASRDGDTVFVGPGTYSDATACGDGESTPTVAIISKRIYLKSTDGKESTIILGQHGTTTGGCGTGARRCIYTSAPGAVVDGFTLLNGATVKTTGGNDSSSCGGGIVANTDGGQNDAKGCHNTVQAWIVNSTIDNCRASHGAAVGRGVVPINCLIRRNVSIDGNHCTYRSYCSYNCIYEGNGNGSGYALAISCGHCAVNCTFLLNQAGTNPGAASSERGRSYNCAFIGNQDEAVRSDYSLVSHCVTTFTTGFVAADADSKTGVYRFQYASPLMGDYTVVGDDLVDAGSDDLLAGDCDWIPAGSDVYGYKMVGNSGAWTVYHYPEMKPDKGFYMMPLYAATCSNVTLSAVLTDSVKYAQPGLADYTGADGSTAKPYETIQEAINAVAAWGVVYARPGTYDKGFTTQGFVDGQDTNSTPNRVYVNKHIRVSSTDGAEATIIQGAKDTSAAGAYDGCGPAAIRCVLANQSYYSCVQGFTLSGGATDGDLANRGSWDKDGSGNPRFNSSDSLNRGNFGGGGYRCGNWRSNVEVGAPLNPERCDARTWRVPVGESPVYFEGGVWCPLSGKNMFGRGREHDCIDRCGGDCRECRLARGIRNGAQFALCVHRILHAGRIGACAEGRRALSVQGVPERRVRRVWPGTRGEGLLSSGRVDACRRQAGDERGSHRGGGVQPGRVLLQSG